MIPPLDIFVIDPHGEVHWLEPAPDIESAKARLGTAMPGKYAIFSQTTGNQRFFTVEEEGEVINNVKWPKIFVARCFCGPQPCALAT